MIDGMVMDVVEDICVFDELMFDFFCDCVVSVVGWLLVRIFGMLEVEGIMLLYYFGCVL